MRRRGLLATFIALILAPLSAAFAAQIPPAKCLKVGQTTVFAGKKFTCIRVKVKGKYKLAWNKGVPIPVTQTASPSPTPSPTQTASPSPTPSPTQTAVAPKSLGTTLTDSSSLAIGETKFYAAKNRLGMTVTYIVHRSKNGVIIMNDVCTHQGCAVKLKSEGLLCPCHNSLFNATSGEVERGPATQSLQRFEAIEENGKIIVVD